MNKSELLAEISFGQRIAEEEVDDLEAYFIETDQWKKLYSGNVDVVYGMKGSGKSALYALLSKKVDELFDRGVLIQAAENVAGATAFQNLRTDPPPTEEEFKFIWKLYCLSIIGSAFRDFGITQGSAKELITSLETSGLLPESSQLRIIFNAARKFLNSILNREAAATEYTITVEPNTGSPIVTKRTEFRERHAEPGLDDIPVDELLTIAEEALAEAGYEIWLIFDRLDVAFPGQPELERNALRALFRVYSDFRAYRKIRLKIFVRDDVWRKITDGGFAEASHITKYVNIDWDREDLASLLVRRILKNDVITEYYGINKDLILSSIDRQLEFLFDLLPDQVESGRNPKTFDWMLSRTRDGTRKNAPRELIHLLDSLRNEQLRRLERGEKEPPSHQLFDRSVFKDALKEVSRVRYEQTLLAEYPDVAEFMKSMEGAKAEQDLGTLAELWGTNAEQTRQTCDRLIDIGFFENPGTGSRKDASFWVPFIYRDALKLVQGKAR